MFLPASNKTYFPLKHTRKEKNVLLAANISRMLLRGNVCTHGSKVPDRGNVCTHGSKVPDIIQTYFPRKHIQRENNFSAVDFGCYCKVSAWT